MCILHISNDMKIFCCTNFFDDILNKLRAYKWRAVFCAVLSIIGIVLGVVLFNAAEYDWWYMNRCSFADRIFNGGFSLFFYFFFTSAVYFLLLVLCGMRRFTQFICLIILTVYSLYCGANAAAVIVCYKVYGILFVILVVTVEAAGYFLACFLCMCECACQKTFKESCRDLRGVFCVVLLNFLVKIICFFVVLRILTAFI